MVERYVDWLREWNRLDREAWAEYRRWEKIHFPINDANPLSFPRGMFAARREFEKEQRIKKAGYLLQLKERNYVKW